MLSIFLLTSNSLHLNLVMDLFLFFFFSFLVVPQVWMQQFCEEQHQNSVCLLQILLTFCQYLSFVSTSGLDYCVSKLLILGFNQHDFYKILNQHFIYSLDIQLKDINKKILVYLQIHLNYIFHTKEDKPMNMKSIESW